MPDFSGWDFLEQFEKLQQSLKKSVRIYIVSSSVNPKDIARAKKYPFVHDFITKPVKRDLLDSLYASYLDRIAS
ncbi:CheY-like chemotaxis protein [Mucilaginibacter sp. UYNi724]